MRSKDAGVGERMVTRITGELASTRERTRDTLICEEPLEIRWAGDTLATTMRTPGQDHDLALGFLRAEGVISSLSDVGSVAHCGRVGDEHFGNVIDVTPGPGVAIDVEQRLRRGTLVSSSCGVCGRQSIDDLLARESALHCTRSMPVQTILQATRTLREHQPLFAATGGVHGAALWSQSGRFLAASEDIGRHNAVDKLIGMTLRGAFADARRSSDAGDDAPCLLVVSGRISFEIVHKAAVLRVPIVASISAASTLAVDLAEALGICALGFVRVNRANIYSCSDRVRER